MSRAHEDLKHALDLLHLYAVARRDLTDEVVLAHDSLRDHLDLRDDVQRRPRVRAAAQRLIAAIDAAAEEHAEDADRLAVLLAELARSPTDRIEVRRVPVPSDDCRDALVGVLIHVREDSGD